MKSVISTVTEYHESTKKRHIILMNDQRHRAQETLSRRNEEQGLKE